MGFEATANLDQDAADVNISKCRKRPRTFEEKVARYKQKYPSYKVVCSCSYACSEAHTEEDKDQINNSFWDMDYSSRRGWLLAHVKEVPIKRRTRGTESRRQASRTYTLPVTKAGYPVADKQLCKKYFMSVLGLKSDKMLNNLFHGTKDKLGSLEASPLDKRGRHTPSNKKDADSIANHISSYKQTQILNQESLPSELRVAAMHRDYLATHPTQQCCYEVYRKVFNDVKSIVQISNVS